MSKPLLLAIETSCDETAVALTRGYDTVKSFVLSQIKEHRPYGGVVPEIASRKHVIALSYLLRRAFAEVGFNFKNIDGIAVTKGPGLVGALMVGMTAAKELALVFNKPLITVNHLEAHIFSVFAGSSGLKLPFICLIVSGGHTMLVNVESLGSYKVIGETLDDAAGEAFDKVGKFLGYTYPGGPQIEAASKKGDETKYDLPRPLISSKDLKFSFSGLKTAVIYKVRKLEEQNKKYKREDLAASFQKAVSDVLVHKSFTAAQKNNIKRLAVVGGVSSNSYLRTNFVKVAQERCIELILPAKDLATDNAAMVGFAASQHFKEHNFSDLNETVNPNWSLPFRIGTSI